MADQCIVCLEALPIAPAKSDSTNVKSPREVTQVLPEIIKLDHDSKSKGLVVAVLRTCGHTLHNSCLQEWIKKANSCPICRQAFNDVEVYDAVGGGLISKYTVKNKTQVAEFDPSDWIDFNEPDSEPCCVCGSGDHEDRLLLCDGCDAPYHSYCVDLDHIPAGEWFCLDCAIPLRTRRIVSDERATPVLRATSRARTWAQRTRTQLRRARHQARHQAAQDNRRGIFLIGQGEWNDWMIDRDFEDEGDDVTDDRNHERDTWRAMHPRTPWQESYFRRRALQTVGPRPTIHVAEQSEASKHTADEEKAWETFENVRGSDANGLESRKRKAESISRSPTEQSTDQEPKQKRPKTRRVISTPTSSSHRGFSHGLDNSTSMSASNLLQPKAKLAHESTNAPSLLSSLLKEVEMSTSTKNESSHLPRSVTVISPSVGHPSPAASPCTSNYSSPRALSTTPPPHRLNRPGSPLPLSSRVGPAINHTPSRRPVANHKQSNGEIRGPISPPADKMPQLSPRRVISGDEKAATSRPAITVAVKERINGVVRTALEPYYKTSARITRDQYIAINRYVSHQLYDKAEAIHESDTFAWDKIAAEKVARAVERHLA